MDFPSVASLTSRGDRRDSPEAFFAGFRSAWDVVRCQVLKLETRQSYQEPGNPSWQALQAGDWDRAMNELSKSRQKDDPLYADLRKRGIDFVRCRPLVFPASAYVRWEYRVYESNMARGERIFGLNRDVLAEFFDSIATHDFMVFDTRLACIHDYDQSGLIQGGWWIEDQSAIRALVAVHGVIKANAQPIEQYAGALR